MSTEIVDFGNGFSAYTAAKDEAFFIFNEIFNDECYNVAPLPEKPFIIDVGANIGLSIIYFKKKYPSAKVIGFEPAPATYATLLRNIELHKLSDVDTHQCALGASEETSTLSFYPLVPGNSTFKPEEKEVYKTIVGKEMRDVLEQVFGVCEKVEVPIKRLTDFLASENLPQSIDLLKIDVEGAELDVCRGLDDEGWSRVRNVAIEVFDLNDAMAETKRFVESKGLSVKAELAIKGQDDPNKPRLFLLIGHRE